VSDRPLVLIPLELAGEACAPIAVMAGDDPSATPVLLTVPNPLSRTDRFAFATGLAGVVLSYIDSHVGHPVPGERDSYPDAPQLIMPGAGGVTFTRLLGRSTRFRRTTGEWAVPLAVPLLGRWLTYFAERSQHPGSSLLLTATGTLAAHWATGQSAAEDQNLATLLAWIDPPAGLTGAEAAQKAESPVICPPAGPATDPAFDRDVLQALYKEIGDARATADAGAERRARLRLERELDIVLKPTWGRVWQAIGLLRSLPEGGHVAERWKADLRSFTWRARYIRDGGLPQAKRDAAVDAARKLADLEDEQQRLEAQMAFDDPLVMAEYQVSGQAFRGVVTDVQLHLDESGKRAKLRPWVWLDTTDEVAIEAGAEVRSPARPTQKVILKEILPLAGGTRVRLEVQDKMGSRLEPAPGSVPEAGDDLCYTSLTPDGGPPARFPAREATPWTHGGPPPEYIPTEADAGESWDGDAYADGALEDEGEGTR
jgi:hypothetical protein